MVPTFHESDTPAASGVCRQPLTGLQAFTTFLKTLSPKDGSQEIWLKLGHNQFYVGEWDETGEFQLFSTKGKGQKRQRGCPVGSAFTYFSARARSEEGGVFYIPTQPQGLPTASAVSCSDDIGTELDTGTTAEQWEKLERFTNVTGLYPSSILSSGGKSLHMHLKCDRHLDLDERQYLARLTCLVLQSDPVTVRLHQPMRIPGFFRLEKCNEQELLYWSLNRYTFPEIVERLFLFFQDIELPFPDEISEDWWRDHFHPLLKSSSQFSESEKVSLIKAELVGGLDTYRREKSLGTIRQKSQKRYVTRLDGKSLVDLIEEACEELGASVFNHAQHQWQWEGPHKARGCCPFHDSKSKNSAWISPFGDGAWGYHCTACTDDKPINGFTYWFYLEYGFGTRYPSGKEFIDVAHKFLSTYGFQGSLQSNFQEEKDKAHNSNPWKSPVSHNGDIGYWVENKGRNKEDLSREFDPKCNFDFDVKRELLSQEGSGSLVLLIKRSLDGFEKKIILPSCERLTSSNFTKALVQRFGVDIVCNLKDEELNNLFHVRLKRYRDSGGQLFTLANRIGCQDSGYWIFDKYQFTPDGNLTTEEFSQTVFNTDLSTDEDKIQSPKIAPPSRNALSNLILAMRQFHRGPNLFSSFILLGWVVAGIHYQVIMNLEGRFPILNIFGDPESGKTIAAENALSLIGANKTNMFSRITVSALYERLKLSGSLSLCWDDPPKDSVDEEIFKALYNGEPRIVRGNVQHPHSPLMVTSNHALGENSSAIASRLISVPIFKDEEANTDAWDCLERAREKASGALSDLIKLGYPAGEIRSLSKELRQYMPKAHGRMGFNIGLVTWYAMEIANMANIDPTSVRSYAIEELCRVANNSNLANDSLADFLEKLLALKGKGVVGAWDIRKATKRSNGGEYLSIVMTSVWPVLDREYQLAYSRKIVEELIEKRGGIIRDKQRFYENSTEFKDYRRAIITGNSNEFLQEPKQVSKNCISIPVSVLESSLGLGIEDLAD